MSMGELANTALQEAERAGRLVARRQLWDTAAAGWIVDDSLEGRLFIAMAVRDAAVQAMRPYYFQHRGQAIGLLQVAIEVAAQAALDEIERLGQWQLGLEA